MYFRRAHSDEQVKIYALYKSVTGSRFCVWNDLYPGMDEIRHDYETGNLFVLIDGEALAGAISVVPENEMDSLPCWKVADGAQREIARVAVDKRFQGNGIARKLINPVLRLLSSAGCSSVHLSVAEVNIPAMKTYRKLGFEIVGEADMYNNHYLLLEKVL